MLSIKDFLSRYKTKKFFPTLDHMNRGVAFRDKKCIDKLNLGCVLLSVANIYLQSSISAQKVSTVFAALLREVPKGCKEAVLPEALTKNHQVICLLYEESTRKLHNDNLCLFGDLALHFNGNGGTEVETSEMFNPCQEKTGAANPPSFCRVCMNYNPSASDLV